MPRIKQKIVAVLAYSIFLISPAYSFQIKDPAKVDILGPKLNAKKNVVTCVIDGGMPACSTVATPRRSVK